VITITINSSKPFKIWGFYFEKNSPIIPALGRLRQHYVFEASLDYIASLISKQTTRA
jgi:hypothetical protein